MDKCDSTSASIAESCFCLFVGAGLCSAKEAFAVSLVTLERLQGLLSIKSAIKKMKKINVEKSFQDGTLT